MKLFYDFGLTTNIVTVSLVCVATLVASFVSSEGVQGLSLALRGMILQI
jgi:hypothetical protein